MTFTISKNYLGESLGSFEVKPKDEFYEVLKNLRYSTGYVDELLAHMILEKHKFYQMRSEEARHMLVVLLEATFIHPYTATYEVD